MIALANLMHHVLMHQTKNSEPTWINMLALFITVLSSKPGNRLDRYSTVRWMQECLELGSHSLTSSLHPSFPIQLLKIQPLCWPPQKSITGIFKQPTDFDLGQPLPALVQPTWSISGGKGEPARPPDISYSMVDISTVFLHAYLKGKVSQDKSY